MFWNLAREANHEITKHYDAFGPTEHDATRSAFNPNLVIARRVKTHSKKLSRTDKDMPTIGGTPPFNARALCKWYPSKFCSEPFHSRSMGNSPKLIMLVRLAI